MDNIIVRRSKNTSLMAFYYFYIALMSAATIFCVLAFVLGIAPAFGKNVTIITAVELIFGVLYMNGNLYRGFFGGFLGLLFLIFLAVMIKNVVSSFRFIKKLSNSKILTNLDARNTVLTYGAKVSDCYLAAISFAMVCEFVDDFIFSNIIYILGLIWIFTILITRILCSVVDRYNFSSLLTKLLYDIITSSALIIFLFSSKFPAIKLFVHHAKGVPVNFGQSLIGMIMPVIYFILTCLAIKIMSEINSTIHIQNYNLRSLSKVLIFFSVALAVGSIVVYVAGGYKSRIDFEALINMFKPYFSFILLSIALLVSSYFPQEYVKRSIDEGKEAFYEVNEDGVLKIFDHITEIQAFAFEDRTDIKKVYIPSSVMVVGENAFSGCTRIFEIRCDHQSAPEGWSPSWNEGCDATLFWKLVVPVKQEIEQPAAQPFVQFVVQPVVQPAAQPVNQPVEQPVYQPFVQPVEQPMYQPMYQPAPQPMNQPMNQPVYQPVDQPMYPPVDQPMYPPVNQPPAQPMNQPMYQPMNQPMNQPMYQPINQPMYPPMNQPPAQPNNQPNAYNQNN